MIGIDSNVLVRLIARDDAAQTAHADRILDAAGEEGLVVGLIVLAELAWVLRRAFHYEPPAILDAVQYVLDGREFHVERRSLAQAALSRARAAGCGYADAVIELIHLEAGADVTLTFDIKAKRLPTMQDAATYR